MVDPTKMVEVSFYKCEGARMTTRISEVIHEWLGWCPDGQRISASRSVRMDPTEIHETVGPDTIGGPRDTRLFRVPRDMLGMLISPVRTIRNSKQVPLSRIIIWYSILIVLNSLFWSAIVYTVISNLPIWAQPAESLSWLTVYYFFSLITIAVLMIGVSSGVLYGICRVLGSHSGILNTLRAVLYGITPVLIIEGAGGEVQMLMSTIIGFDHGITIVEVLPWIFFLWAIILISLGLRELQGLSNQRAFSAVVLPAAVFIMLLVWLLFTNPYDFFTFSIGGFE